MIVDTFLDLRKRLGEGVWDIQSFCDVFSVEFTVIGFSSACVLNSKPEQDRSSCPRRGNQALRMKMCASPILGGPPSGERLQIR